jgi:hypothetical protein
MIYEQNGTIYGPEGEELSLTAPPRKTISLTTGLKKRRLKISAKAVGEILLKKGIFKIHERRSTKTGEIKIFKKIADDFLHYGKNKEGRNGTTSPLFYEDKFLLLCLEIKIIQ